MVNFATTPLLKLNHDVRRIRIYHTTRISPPQLPPSLKRPCYLRPKSLYPSRTRFLSPMRGKSKCMYYDDIFTSSHS
ncbi:hypothetical protein M413DRAFT_449145 [Hebeloma cylindrosporum]|uniref:Uncharacterized protein n=1 Tax=Hebeloma cylindrosporum TaxID=76867 RepID=A0A0C3BI90_HEBCY|nr:hypothetical protein M413DRAFT_449145 [Hebeloma cylindrosporum h7]